MEVLVSKGFLIYAENTENVDYIYQAYALALSIKSSQTEFKSVSLVTNVDQIPEKYLKVFDKIIPIPWYDAPGTEFSTEHRWKLYHVTPYEETIVLDSDMLLLDDISLWWEYCSNFDIRYCTKIKNYKNEIIAQDTAHRKTFIENNLTNPYCALHYFKKSDSAFEFYKTLEFVIKNWEWCYTKFASQHYQNWLSMDLSVAIAIEISGMQNEILDNLCPLEFVHMKPAIQHWPIIPESWQTTVPCFLNPQGELFVGNIKQFKLFHYVEKNFITYELVNRLEDLVNGR